jgi:hypothetical protein
MRTTRALVVHSLRALANFVACPLSLAGTLFHFCRSIFTGQDHLIDLTGT